MDFRNDFLLRAIQMLAQILRKMLAKESVDQSIIDQIINDACGIDVEEFKKFPDLIKQMIALSSSNDENKKALAIVCLYLKDKEHYGQICHEILETMQWNLLHPETKELLRTTFNIFDLENLTSKSIF